MYNRGSVCVFVCIKKIPNIKVYIFYSDSKDLVSILVRIFRNCNSCYGSYVHSSLQLTQLDVYRSLTPTDRTKTTETKNQIFVVISEWFQRRGTIWHTDTTSHIRLVVTSLFVPPYSYFGPAEIRSLNTNRLPILQVSLLVGIHMRGPC